MVSESAKQKKNSATGNAERQRTYRKRHKTHALELAEEAYLQLRAICRRQGWTLRKAVAEALDLLQAQVDADARSATLVEMHKQAVKKRAKQDKAYPLPTSKKPRRPKPEVKPDDVEGQGRFL